MLGREKFQGGFKHGELYAAAGETYLGGQPAAINSSGELVLCKSTTVAKFLGIFANDYSVDGVTALAKAQATYYGGGGVFRLQANAAGSYPYDTSKTYTPGEYLNIDSNGKWTNVATGSQPYYGKVLAVGSTYLDVQIFDQP